MALKNSTRKWIRGGIEVLIHGGTAALIVGLMTYKKDMFWSEWREIVVMSFFANGGLRFLQYFANNPLPPASDTSMIDQQGKMMLAPTQMSLNPLSKVQPISKP